MENNNETKTTGFRSKAARMFKKMDKKDKTIRPYKKKNKLVRRLIKIAVVLIVIVVVVNLVLMRVRSNFQTATEVKYSIEKVQKRDVTTVLSSSGSIEPLNIYNITTLVKGEIIAADFEEGDTVEEDQVLYQLTTDEVDKEIETAQKSVKRAQQSYDKAVTNYDKAVSNYQEYLEDLKEKQADYDEALADYNEALAEYEDATIRSNVSGVITTLYVEEGDAVQENGKIADIYDDSTMVLTVPFNAEEVANDWVGKTAGIEISGSFEVLKGTVTEVTDKTSILSGNQIVRMVSIEVENPGGLTTSTIATASVDGEYSNSEGTFEVGMETTLKADKAADITKLNVKEGSRVNEGDVLIYIDTETIEDHLTSYKNSLTSAENSFSSMEEKVENAESSVTSAQDNIDDAKDTLEDAEENYDDVVDSLADTQITSPVTGIVVSKNMLVGDTIGTSNFSSTLAVIYDVSAVTFEMSIDELDIKSVEVGQTVNVTADAIENTVFEGRITNVSLVSTTSGGVTQYPVTVQIDDVGELLTGMNVTGEIILEGVTDVLTVPVDALQRGNNVYVKDDSVTEAEGNVPVGFRSVSVETGLSDGDYIQIVSGLSEGDEVYVTRTSSGNTMMEMGGFGMQGGNMQGGTAPGMSGNGSSGRSGNRSSGNSGGMPGGR